MRQRDGPRRQVRELQADGIRRFRDRTVRHCRRNVPCPRAGAAAGSTPRPPETVTLRQVSGLHAISAVADFAPSPLPRRFRERDTVIVKRVQKPRMADKLVGAEQLQLAERSVEQGHAGIAREARQVRKSVRLRHAAMDGRRQGAARRVGCRRARPRSLRRCAPARRRAGRPGLAIRSRLSIPPAWPRPRSAAVLAGAGARSGCGPGSPRTRNAPHPTHTAPHHVPAGR